MPADISALNFGCWKIHFVHGLVITYQKYSRQRQRSGLKIELEKWDGASGGFEKQ
jgi:hypothetical protein